MANVALNTIKHSKTVLKEASKSLSKPWIESR